VGVVTAAVCLGLAGCSDDDAASPGASASASAGAATPAAGSGDPVPAETVETAEGVGGTATVAPQPEPLPPSPGTTGEGGGVAGVLRAIRAAGLPAASPRPDDCRAQPPGLADGCLEIVRTDTITVWRFDTDEAARRYVTDVAGPAGGVARHGYVVEFGTATPDGLKDRYRKALATVG
jgi:hypothetical protein